MNPHVARLYDRYYPMLEDGTRFRDGTKTFYAWIRSTSGLRDATVLNVGAGPTPEPGVRRLRGEVRHLVGVDVDPVVLNNSDLDDARVIDGPLPFSEEFFDIVYSDWTIEHVAQPAGLIREVHRVLKPGGWFMFRTTNRMHYVTMVAAHTPHGFHDLVANRVRALGNSHHDPWPTYYRLNNPSSARDALASAGFDHIEAQLLEPQPAYLVFNPIAFNLGVLYERLVNRWEWMSRFRLILIVRAQKPDSQTPGQIHY